MTQVATPRDELDLSRGLLALRLYIWPIVITTLLASGATYLVARAQKPVYSARTTLLSAGNQTGNLTVNSTLVSAPPLPEGALERALLNINVLNAIAARVGGIEGASAAEKASIKTSLAREAAESRLSTFQIRGRLDYNFSGTYELTAEAPNPRVAAGLANLAAEELVRWDALRGAEKVTRARQALEAQLKDNESRIRQLGGALARSSLEQRSLLEQRVRINDQLNSVRALERAVSGTLSVLTPAVAPLRAIRPRPTRDAALAALLGLFASAGLVLLRVSLDRTVGTDSDLKALDVRLLGEVPRLKGSRQGAVLSGLRRGQAAEGVSFLRANLNTLLFKSRPKIILVTSATPGEGKSSLTASLGDAFAAAGQKTLIIDADLRRPRQNSLWDIAAQTADWINLPGAAPFPGEEARDLQAALRQPEAGQAKKLRDSLHLLSAGPVSNQAAELLTGGALGASLKLWSSGYDVILLDSPPALVVADPTLIAPYASGVLVVIEAGRTTQGALRRAIDALALSQANILGVVLNKVDPRQREGQYGYGYSYGAQAGKDQ